jgi:hypothetical protein
VFICKRRQSARKVAVRRRLQLVTQPRNRNGMKRPRARVPRPFRAAKKGHPISRAGDPREGWPFRPSATCQQRRSFIGYRRRLGSAVSEQRQTFSTLAGHEADTLASVGDHAAPSSGQRQTEGTLGLGVSSAGYLLLRARTRVLIVFVALLG